MTSALEPRSLRTDMTRLRHSPILLNMSPLRFQPNIFDDVDFELDDFDDFLDSDLVDNGAYVL